MRTLRSISVLASTLAMLAAAALLAPAEIASAQSDDDCLACHEEEFEFKPTRGVAPGPPAAHPDSYHGQMGLSCVDCHADLSEEWDYPHPDEMSPVGCALCHSDIESSYAAGVHASIHEDGQPYASCADCHGAHDIRPAEDDHSTINHFRVPDTCAVCHADPEVALSADDPALGALACFDKSVHGHALRNHGLVVAPNCSTCHGAHEIVRPGDAESRVHRDNVPDTCGECHKQIQERFNRGIHGQQLAAGNPAGPVCTDCHTYHQISTSALSNWRLEVTMECGHCHEDAIETYRDTFHGKVTALGFTRVATCSDCHGPHEIYPAENPLSMVSAENRLATCRSCHPGAGPKFADYDPHADEHDKERSPVLYWSARFMKLLLVGVFTFFFAHTALWAPRSWITRRRKKTALRREAENKARGRESGDDA